MNPLIEQYLKVFDDLRQQVVETVNTLSEDEINRPVRGLRNTIGILLRHLAGSERYWVGEVVGGVPARRDRDAEFGKDRVRKEALLADLGSAAALTRDVLGRLSLEDLLTTVQVQRTRGVVSETKGFALLHATQHLAYHLGQVRYLARLVQASGDQDA